MTDKLLNQEEIRNAQNNTSTSIRNLDIQVCKMTQILTQQPQVNSPNITFTIPIVNNIVNDVTTRILKAFIDTFLKEHKMRVKHTLTS